MRNNLGGKLDSENLITCLLDANDGSESFFLDCPLERGTRQQEIGYNTFMTSIATKLVSWTNVQQSVKDIQ
jgi:hypothetical protein